MAEKVSKHCWTTPKCGITTAEHHFRFDKPIDYRFILVRNPYHRVASFFYSKVIYAGVAIHKRRPDTYDEHRQIPHLNMGDTRVSFRQFIQLLKTVNVERADRHLKPQYLGVTDMKFDNIVRCESYAEDIKPVCDALDLDYEEYAKLNVNHTERIELNEFVADYSADWFRENGIPKRYDVFYDDDIEEIVWNKYRQDFELFDYARRDI